MYRSERIRPRLGQSRSDHQNQRTSEWGPGRIALT